MQLHREGRVTLAIVIIFFLVANIGGAFLLPGDSIWLFWIFLVTAVLLVFFLQFFRNPKRRIVEDDRAVLAPADGKVVVIERAFDKEYTGREMVMVSIFMSPLNAHMNLMPGSGTIEHLHYHDGKYLMAFNPKSSQENERTSIGLKLNNGHKLLIRQVAGFLARRICYYVKRNDQLKQGDEFGFIKFGSRLDVFMPVGTEITVKKGQATTAGQTPIGLLPLKVEED